MSQNIKSYWENRYNKKFNIDGSGHPSFNMKYNSFVYKAYERTLQKAIDIYSIQIKGKTIFDVGAGTGYWIKFYQKYSPRDIFGIDITDKSVLELNTQFPQYNFENMDLGAKKIVFPEKFDIVHCFDVLYYILDDSFFETAIENLVNAAAEDAFFFITDIFEEVIPKGSSKFNYFRSLKNFKDVLSSKKVEILGLYPVNYLMKKPIPIPYLYSWIKWQLSKVHVDLEGFIGWALYCLDPFFMRVDKSDIKLMVCKKSSM